MTLRELVADNARRLDAIKPGWERLIPLDDFDMRHRSRCMLGWVFGEDAKAEIKHRANGFEYVMLHHNPGLDLHRPSDVNANSAFSHNVPASLWREEITARLEAPLVTIPKQANADTESLQLPTPRLQPALGK